MYVNETVENKSANVKTSLFNEYLGCIEGRWVLYNNLSCAMIDVKEDLYNAILNNQLTALSPQSILTLKQAKFLVAENQDEVQEIRDKNKSIQENNEVIGLQILPSTFCNFGCSYCFEHNIKTRNSMSQDVMDHIISWVRHKVKPTSKVVNVMWFGGEPLLAMEQIVYLSKSFLEITRESQLVYYASIVTNGYLLTEKNIDLLLESKVSTCTVTLDGPEAIHDRRRVLKNGGATWRTIVNNIKLAIKKGIHVTIRINVDKSNCDYLDPLLDALAEENILNEVGYNFGTVTYFGQACSSIEDQVISTEEMNKLFDQKKITDLLKGSKTFKSPIHPDFVGCLANSIHSYVVGPKGELYKCTKSIGSQDESCGNINNPDAKHPNFLKWLNLNNFHSELCSGCSLFPICRGTVCANDVLSDPGKNGNCSLKNNKSEYHDRLVKMYQNKMSGQIKK